MKNLFSYSRARPRFRVTRASICLLVCLAGLLPASSVVADIGEYTLKAVYMWRFPRFIEWPRESEIGDASKPIIIAVIGPDPFDGKLEELASKRKIINKKVVVRRISDADEIRNVHILFIGKLKEKEMKAVLSFTRTRPILTISDMENASEKGVMINFRITRNKLGFEINETAAHRAGLVISSRLLRIASKIVRPVER